MGVLMEIHQRAGISDDAFDVTGEFTLLLTLDKCGRAEIWGVKTPGGGEIVDFGASIPLRPSATGTKKLVRACEEARVT